MAGLVPQREGARPARRRRPHRGRPAALGAAALAGRLVIGGDGPLLGAGLFLYDHVDEGRRLAAAWTGLLDLHERHMRTGDRFCRQLQADGDVVYFLGRPTLMPPPQGQAAHASGSAPHCNSG